MVQEVNINGKDFWHYTAKDTHGSGCSIYMVDKVTHDEKQFKEAILEAAGPAASVLRGHLHSKFLWGGRMDPVYDQTIEFSLNGKQFSQLLHTERKFGRGPQDFAIDNVSVSAKEFDSALDAELKPIRLLVYQALVTLHPSYHKAKPLENAPWNNRGTDSDLDDKSSWSR
ncbi:hypothetical protein V0M98_36010 (plasmid) [Pseudomonas silesiensis]|uniref:hypothetical protein n=1 Tax=Pseudomonas silesiensis TaxID=1853130 RepID=UPI0030D2D1B1